jgi:hypothetical protein
MEQRYWLTLVAAGVAAHTEIVPAAAVAPQSAARLEGLVTTAPLMS